jgi:hypothetical protein
MALRLPGGDGRIACRVWPLCFLFAGIILPWNRQT